MNAAQEFYNRYETDAAARAECRRNATLIGISSNGDPAYQFTREDGRRMIIRHNNDGTYTWIL